MRRLAAFLLLALPLAAQTKTSLPSGARMWPNPAAGTIFYVTNGTTGALGSLALGSSGQCLQAGSGAPTWAQVAYSQVSGTPSLAAVATSGSASDLGSGTLPDARLSSNVVTLTGTQTLTNKRITPRVGSTATSATPSIDSDSYDLYEVTALTDDITSVTVTGTPTDGQTLWLAITAAGTQSITLGSQFEASSIPLPTTISGTRLDLGFIWTGAHWRMVAIA